MLLCEKEDSGTYDNFIWSSDNCVDGFTFDSLITALQCNVRKDEIDEEKVWKQFNEIVSSQLEDARFLLAHSMKNIIKAVKGESDKKAGIFYLSDWKGDFSEQFKPGDRFDQEVYEYFLNILPPTLYSDSYLQVGEPHSHIENSNGDFQATYCTFVKVDDDVWEYRGNCFKGKRNEFKNIDKA